MANNTIRRSWNMYSMVNIEDLRGSAFQAEDGGHTFEITGLDASGNTVALSGTVAAVFLRADNTDVAISGSVSGGKVYVTLTDECYGYPGRFGLTIFLTSGGQKVAIYAAIGSVHRTSSGSVSPETAQDVVDLINEIEAAIAQIPSSYTDIMAAVAPTYSNTAVYAVGSYVWYEGKLYRCITAINTAESWTSGHWTLADIASGVSELKGCLNADQNAENMIPDIITKSETAIPFIWENGHIDTSTGRDIVRDSNQRAKGYIPLFGKKISVKSTNSNVVCYLYEYDRNFIFLEAHNTTTTYISPVNNNTVFVRVSTYSATIPQSELNEAITGIWENPDAVSEKTICGQMVDSLGRIDTTISGTQGFSTNVYIPVFKGRTYVLENTTSNSVVFNVLNADGTFEIIETIGAGVTYTYTANSDYYGVRVYFAATGSCSFRSIDGGVFSLINGNREDNEEIRNIVIDNGIANEFIILHDTLKKPLKIPNKAAFEIATIDGSTFTENSVIMYASDGTTVLNTWNLSQYSGNKRSITNNSGDGYYVKLANFPLVGIKITAFTKKKQPEKIRLMQYNIGKFNYGHSGGLAEDVQEKIANYKSFLAQYQPNICGMEEYTQYIDSSSSYGSDETLFNDLYFFGNKDFDVELAVKSDYDYRYFTNFYIKDDNNETAGSFVEYYADIKNTEVVIVAGAIAAGKAAEVRAGGFENLLKKYASKTNVIILIDTNVISATEHTALVTTAEGYSYKVANGGYFGTFDTYNLNSEYYHKIDNVLVKGNIVLKNVIVPDVYADLSSDHYPMIADIDLMI